jgi:REP element-mobilizing transposase RayT
MAPVLARLFRSVAQEERGRVLEIGMVSTHAHLLLTLHPQADISRLVQRLKGGSSYIASRLPAGGILRWAGGYTLETVSPSAVESVRAYLRSQPQHHPMEALAGWSDEDSGVEHLRPASPSPSGASQPSGGFSRR